MKNELHQIEKILKLIIWTICVIFCLFFLVKLVEYFIDSRELENDTATFLGQSGDFFGGVVGTLLSFLTLLLVYKTYKSQEKELKVTRRQMDKQQFEKIYFQMLDMLYLMGKEINFKKGNNQITGISFFQNFIESMKKYYNVSIDEKFNIQILKMIERDYNLVFYDTYKEYELQGFEDENGELDSDYFEVEIDRLSNREGFIDWVRANPKEYLGIVFEKVYYEYGATTGYYFRYIVTTR